MENISGIMLRIRARLKVEQVYLQSHVPAQFDSWVESVAHYQDSNGAIDICRTTLDELEQVRQGRLAITTVLTNLRSKTEATRSDAYTNAQAIIAMWLVRIIEESSTK